MIRKKVQTTGDSLFVVIPKVLADDMGIEAGSMIDLEYDSKKITISKDAQGAQ